MIQTYTLPASHQEATDTAAPDDPVPDQFEVSDFLPDEDRMLAPAGEVAAVTENDVLRFVLIKQETSLLSSPGPSLIGENTMISSTMQPRLPCPVTALPPLRGPTQSEVTLPCTQAAAPPSNISVSRQIHQPQGSTLSIQDVPS